MSASIRLRVLPQILPLDGRDVEMRVTSTFIQWRYTTDLNGEYAWTDLIAIADLIGAPGPAIELRTDGVSIQYRTVGTDDDSWVNIIPLIDLKGAPGDQGAPGDKGDTGDQGPAGTLQVPGIQPQGRLSLTAGVAAPESDVVGATSIHYPPSSGVYVPVFDGAAFLAKNIGAGLTMALNANSGHAGYHAANTNFDLFVIDDGGTLRLVTGPAWTAGAVAGSNVARGTGAGSTELEEYLGYPVNKNSMTVRFGSASGNTVVVPARRATYVGSFRATANGQATDSKASRLLFNAFNQLPRPLKVVDPATSWTYNTAAYRQANGNPSMKLQVLLGLRGVAVEAEYSVVVNNPTANSFVLLAIGLDSTTTPSTDSYGGATFLGVPTRDVATKYSGFPGLGLHEIYPLENSAAVGTSTFYAAGSGYRTGLYGSLLG